VSKYVDLITITKVNDSETGLENIGDLDYRIHCNALEQWLARGAGQRTPMTVSEHRALLATELRALADYLDSATNQGPFTVTIEFAERLYAKNRASTLDWIANTEGIDAATKTGGSQ